jgi:hypothetical protein
MTTGRINQIPRCSGQHGTAKQHHLPRRSHEGTESTLVFTLEGANTHLTVSPRPAAATAPAHRGNASNRPIVLTVSPPGPNRTQRPADPRRGCSGLRHPGLVRGDQTPRSRRRTAATEGWRSPWCEREAGVSQRPATHITQTTPSALHTQRPRGLTHRGEDAEAPIPDVLGRVPH